jgi:hypothetical protein
MTRLKYNKTSKDSTPNHLKRKAFYKKATRKQIKLMKDLGISFQAGISSHNASLLIGKKLGQELGE